MNQKQGLKLYIEELEETLAAKEQEIANHEHYNNLSKRDITAYNQCILAMIDGGNPCDWCEEKRLGECEHTDLDGKGCQDWFLKDLDAVAQETGEEQEAVQVEGVLPEGEKDG